RHVHSSDMQTNILPSCAQRSEEEKQTAVKRRRTEVGIFDINFDTGERYWSYELRHILGIPRDTPAEFHLLLQRVHPEDRRAFGQIAMQPFRQDCPAYQASEFRIVQDDGSAHWVHTERV